MLIIAPDQVTNNRDIFSIFFNKKHVVCIGVERGGPGGRGGGGGGRPPQ